MADTEPLFALLELMLRTFTSNVPKIKPGGHPEDIFLQLNDDEREQIECSICYQILKDVRQCENKHKFCYSCIFVWSTSGNPVNHSRCPVCRVEGLYVKNNTLDEKINSKEVKCSMKTCKWTGLLKLLPSHQHTTYSGETQSTSSSTDIKGTELPEVCNSSTTRPPSNPRSRSQASGSQSSLASASQTPTSSRASTQRQHLGTGSLNSSSNAHTTNRSISHNQRPSNGQGNTVRSRTRSRHRQNSSSPQRRSNITATGLPNSRLTSRARIQNNGTVDNRTVNSEVPTRHIPASPETRNSVTEQTTTEQIHVPHPPTTPRNLVQTPRRLPTLPSLSINSNISSNGSAAVQTFNTDNNNNVSNNHIVADGNGTTTPRRIILESSLRNEASLRNPSQPRSFGMIRERLNESRQRLDMLMGVFSTELNRGRHDLASFQQERERRRQEQLAEVRDLGRRLTSVAQELRGLLSQRRQIRSQMDNLLESASDDQD